MQDFGHNWVPRALEHSAILLALAPRLTRLSFLGAWGSLSSKTAQLLQLLHHLKHLRHLTAEGPPEAADALDIALVVSWMT